MTAIALEGREVILESAVIIAELTPPASEIKALPGIPGTRRLKTTPETGVEALETTRGVDTSAAVVPSEAGLSPTPRPTASDRTMALPPNKTIKAKGEVSLPKNDNEGRVGFLTSLSVDDGEEEEGGDEEADAFAFKGFDDINVSSAGGLPPVDRTVSFASPPTEIGSNELTDFFIFL
jgi:hypothetical protein